MNSPSSVSSADLITIPTEIANGPMTSVSCPRKQQTFDGLPDVLPDKRRLLTTTTRKRG